MTRKHVWMVALVAGAFATGVYVDRWPPRARAADSAPTRDAPSNDLTEIHSLGHEPRARSKGASHTPSTPWPPRRERSNLKAMFPSGAYTAERAPALSGIGRAFTMQDSRCSCRVRARGSKFRRATAQRRTKTTFHARSVE